MGTHHRRRSSTSHVFSISFYGFYFFLRLPDVIFARFCSIPIGFIERYVIVSSILYDPANEIRRALDRLRNHDNNNNYRYGKNRCRPSGSVDARSSLYEFMIRPGHKMQYL
uniref:Uncharacterized protein n=1 Tax=Sipha flava TaxID=143950 RepID=A0A2S2QXB0_9HEMI